MAGTLPKYLCNFQKLDHFDRLLLLTSVLVIVPLTDDNILEIESRNEIPRKEQNTVD